MENLLPIPNKKDIPKEEGTYICTNTKSGITMILSREWMIEFHKALEKEVKKTNYGKQGS